MADAEALLRTWLKRARESQFAHYAAAGRLSKLHYFLGVPAAPLSTVVGTAVFASLDTTVNAAAKIGVGIVSIAAAVLTGLQTFWRFSERAERHRATAGEYACIGRDIEQLLIFIERATYDVIAEIRKNLDDIATRAPSVSHTDWAAAQRAADKAYFLASPEPALGERSDAATPRDRT